MAVSLALQYSSLFWPQKVVGEKFEALYPHNAEAYRNEGAVWNGEAFMKLMDSLN